MTVFFLLEHSSIITVDYLNTFHADSALLYIFLIFVVIVVFFYKFIFLCNFSPMSYREFETDIPAESIKLFNFFILTQHFLSVHPTGTDL